MRLCEATKEGIAYAAEILSKGGLVAFPTETVYGLGADASNRQAVARIFAAKGRPIDHPLIVHLANAEQIDRWAKEIPAVAWQIAEHFWPGPLTLILQRASGVLDAVTGGQATVGLRVPGNKVALELLKAFGGGLAAPSANRFGRISPTTAAHVLAEFGNEIDCIVDGGPCSVGLESTILDLSGRRPQILRPGAIKPQDLANILGQIPDTKVVDAPRASGNLPSHYAPDTPLMLVKSSELEIQLRGLIQLKQTLAVLSIQKPDFEGAELRWISMPANSAAYGRTLYARLREADEWNCQQIVAELPPDTAEWDAVHDRLTRAAYKKATSQNN